MSSAGVREHLEPSPGSGTKWGAKRVVSLLLWGAPCLFEGDSTEPQDEPLSFTWCGADDSLGPRAHQFCHHAQRKTEEAWVVGGVK